MAEYPVLSPSTIQVTVEGITPALCPHILLALYLWQGVRCFPCKNAIVSNPIYVLLPVPKLVVIAR